jgi:hypothetical protein
MNSKASPQQAYKRLSGAGNNRNAFGSHGAVAPDPRKQFVKNCQGDCLRQLARVRF